MSCDELLDMVRESDLLSFIYTMIFSVFYVIGYLFLREEPSNPILVE